MAGVDLTGRYKGTVIKYHVERGFGFVRVLDKKIQEDAFIHFSQIETQDDSFKKLLPDQMVEFNLQRGDRGLVATDLKMLDGFAHD